MEELIVKNSDIEGKGVFAGEVIKKGKTICFMKGDEISLDEITRRFNEGSEGTSDQLQIDDEEYIDLIQPFRSINHSCEPNSFVRGKDELVALKDIKKGEEITYDYSTTMADNIEEIKKAGRKAWACKCNCCAKKCRGVINQFNTLPKSTQNFYIKNKYLPDFMSRKFIKI